MVTDEISSHEAKQQCSQGTDEEAVTMETASKETASSLIDNGMKNDDIVDDDTEDDESEVEIEDGELMSSSSSESELEPEETVQEKGICCSVLFSSTPNKAGLDVCPSLRTYVHLSTKSFSDLNEI